MAEFEGDDADKIVFGDTVVIESDTSGACPIYRAPPRDETRRSEHHGATQRHRICRA